MKWTKRKMVTGILSLSMLASASFISTAQASDHPTYQVVAGDSLWLISQRNNTTVAELQKLNNLVRTEIWIGEIIKLPNANTISVPVEIASTPQHYRVA
ncbi:MAG: LysM peptidoglycan-binding domain-containing protein, partial [Bacillota bacterium]|nr:LysM peptidoglycan-binding domain-containing protein [Bacillota bacterium]